MRAYQQIKRIIIMEYGINKTDADLKIKESISRLDLTHLEAKANYSKQN